MSRTCGDRVQFDGVVIPGQPTVVQRWGLRYEDGQTLWVADEVKGRKAVESASPDDPCILVTRTITVTATAWAEPEQIVLDRLREGTEDLRQTARSLRGLT